jgi:hypothetical protein
LALVTNSSMFGISSLNRLFNDPPKPFCQGEPGSRYAMVVPLFAFTRLRAWAMNSGPLSLWMNARAGSRLVSSIGTVTTSFSLQRLPMADSTILSTARSHQARLHTMGADLRSLGEDVELIDKLA